MNNTLGYVLATLILAYLLYKLFIRLRLSRGKHRSLAGHSRRPSADLHLQLFVREALHFAGPLLARRVASSGAGSSLDCHLRF